MDLIKTPREMALEKIGAAPASKGPIMSAGQVMLNKSGFVPRFAKGGDVKTIELTSPKPQELQHYVHNTPDFSKIEKTMAHAHELVKSHKANAPKHVSIAIMSMEPHKNQE